MWFPVRTLGRTPGAVALLPLFVLLPLAVAPRALAAEPPLTFPTPAFEKALARSGKLLANPGKVREATAEVARLESLVEGRCGICQLQLAQAEARLGYREKATAMTRAVLASDGPRELAAIAYNQLGSLLLTAQADKSRLDEAEGSLRQAIGLGDDAASYNLASLRLRRGDPAEALDLARHYLDREPKGPAAARARVVVCAARSVLPAGLAGTTPEGGPPLPLIHPSLATAFQLKAPKHIHTPDGELSPYGQVRVKVVVDEEGCVVQVVPPREIADADLRKQAVRLAQGSVFAPATLDGRPVRMEGAAWIGKMDSSSGAHFYDYPPVVGLPAVLDRIESLRNPPIPWEYPRPGYRP